MKSLALFAAICAVALSAGATKMANAATLDFSFSFSDPENGTVTGQVDGLSDNTANQTASAVILDSYDSTALGFICSTPCDTTASPWTVVPNNNSFTVSNGQLTSATYVSRLPNTAELGLAFQNPGTMAELLGPTDIAIGNNLAFSPITTPTTPLPATLPLFATGLGAFGLLGRRRKRRTQAVYLNNKE